MTEQEAEIDQLQRITFPEVSSSAEATPESSYYFVPPQGPFGQQRSPNFNSPPSWEPKHEDTVCEAPVMHFCLSLEVYNMTAYF